MEFCRKSLSKGFYVNRVGDLVRNYFLSHQNTYSKASAETPYPPKKNPARTCGVHCNLTHDKTYFVVCSFILCTAECLYLRLIIPPAGAVLPDGVSLDFASEEELLVFVTVFDPTGIFTLDALGVVVFDVFCVDCAEPTKASAPTRKKLNKAFFITGFLYYKVNLYSIVFLIVNSQLTMGSLPFPKPFRSTIVR